MNLNPHYKWENRIRSITKLYLTKKQATINRYHQLIIPFLKFLLIYFFAENNNLTDNCSLFLHLSPFFLGLRLEPNAIPM